MSYLNHAGTSWPKPAAVAAAAAEALRASHLTWPAAFEAQHARVARAFGISDPARLLLTPGCTSALALAIADVPWQPGERIVTSALEHHALQRPAVQLAARDVAATVIPRAAEEPFDLQRLEDELRGGGVRLVALTAACNVTGELLPLREVVALAHAHGALCLIDGAQVAGWLPIDVEGLGVDLFTFAGHKALQGPWGLGGLYVAPHVSLATPAAVCELPAQGAPACAPMPGYCDAGSVDRAALAGLVAGLDWLEEPDRSARLQRARAQVERLAVALEATGALSYRSTPAPQLLGLRDPSRRLPTLAFTLPGAPSGALAERFTRAGVAVGAGLQCAPQAHAALGSGPKGALRLSAGPQTSDADIERALEVIADL